MACNESVSSRTNGTLTKSYSYDMSGNRKSLIATGKENYVTEYTYDADNRLEREKRTNRDGNIDVSDYLYDGNGNQIKRIKGKSKLNFRGRTTLGIKTEEELKGEYEIREYDLFNQLTSVRDGGDSVSYSYKPDGLRLSKTVKGVKTGFVWDGGKIIETTDVNGNPTGIYKYGLERVADGKKNYYIYNAHGDVTGLTDRAGNMIREYEYDAFGTEVNKDKNDTNSFRYCGEYYDAETESIYLRARNYNPGTGRFTSEDPARDGLNWYAYANNNPIAFHDPTGKATWFIHGTSSDNSTWKSNFLNYYRNKIFPNEPIETHGWSGDNLDTSRRKETKDFAINLAKFSKENPNEPIRLVGHSHGGNFAILVANELLKDNITVDTIITIATPVREYQLESYVYITNPGENVPNSKRLKNVKKHIQVYNEEDKIQILGGNSESFETLINLIDYEFGTANRVFNYATNVEVNVNDLNERGFIDSHSAMHSDIGIWIKYIVPYLR